MKSLMTFILILTLITGVTASYDEECGCEVDEDGKPVDVLIVPEKPFLTSKGYTIDPVEKAIFDPKTQSWFDLETGYAYFRTKAYQITEEEYRARWEELMNDPEVVLKVPPLAGKEKPFITISGLTVFPAKRTVYDPITGLWFDMKTGLIVSIPKGSNLSEKDLEARWKEMKKDREIIRFIPLIS